MSVHSDISSIHSVDDLRDLFAESKLNRVEESNLNQSMYIGRDSTNDVRFNAFVAEINNDWIVKDLENRKSLALGKIIQLREVIEKANDSHMTRFLRVMQTICAVVANIFYYLGWVIGLTTLLAFLTDPTPSLLLLSILKGLGLGFIINQFGPMVFRALESFFKWLEFKWTESYFSKLDSDLNDTLNILREWYKVKDKMQDYYAQVELDLTNLNNFKPSTTQQSNYNAMQNMLHEQLDKIRCYNKAMLNIKDHQHKGGKQFMDVLENRSFYTYLTQKV